MGDYVVEDACVFERKTWIDLVESIKDGRLFSEAKRLALGELPAAVLLEGDEREQLQACGMRREAIEGALVSLGLVFGLPILVSPCPAATVRYLIFASVQLRESAEGFVTRRGRKPHRRRRAQIYLLQGLPGIGPDRAAQLLDTFGSVREVINAEIEELLEVPGIGRKTAEVIYDLVY